MTEEEWTFSTPPTCKELALAIADLQRAMREFCGYAPPADVDWIDGVPTGHDNVVITPLRPGGE